MIYSLCGYVFVVALCTKGIWNYQYDETLKCDAQVGRREVFNSDLDFNIFSDL